MSKNLQKRREIIIKISMTLSRTSKVHALKYHSEIGTAKDRKYL